MLNKLKLVLCVGLVVIGVIDVAGKSFIVGIFSILAGVYFLFTEFIKPAQ